MSDLRIERRWWLTLNIGIGIFMSTLDTSIVNISLPTIVQSLNTDIKTVAWVVMAYLIIITGCLLLMGRLADLFGQRRIFWLGFLTFTIGSGFCGFSPNIYFLIGSRMVQGLGASALMAIGPAIITSAYPEKDRGQALGMLGSIVSIGFITGPLIGGFLVEHLGWRSIFFINLPIGLMGILLSSKVMKGDQKTASQQIDLRGALLLFLFITSLLLFLNRVGWESTPLFWGWILVALICFGLFLIIENHSHSPLVDLRIFKNQSFLSPLGASFFSFWMNGAHNFVLPFFMQIFLGYSPSQMGMLIFPVALTVMVIAPIGGRVSDRIGVRIPTTLGLVITSLIVFSFVFLKRGASDYEILVRHVVLGVGIGFFNPANNSAILGSLPKTHVGVASSFLALARNLGIVIGVAFGEMVVALKSSGDPGAIRGPSIEGMQDVWQILLVIGLIAIFLSWRRGKKEV
ncbi:MAG: MFS transporter [Deltaproteobacteria bacterium]|nr:MFS transporter [Deltaproteobacteria bacterium]MBM4323041.1 MFS transporter [Deltaproteobacteria bacterium]